MHDEPDAALYLAPGQQLSGLQDGPAVALSPDGTRLAYVARQGSTQQLYVRAMDSLEARPIPGTEGAVNPLFSPDGKSFAVLHRPEATSEQKGSVHVTVLLNFFDELRRKLPPGTK